MEYRVWKQGIVIFTALAGLMQAVAQGTLVMQDVLFIVLITAFFVALENDYHKYKQRIGCGEENKHALSSGEPKSTSYPSSDPKPLPRVKYYPRRVMQIFLKAGTFLFLLIPLFIEKHGIPIFRYRVVCRS